MGVELRIEKFSKKYLDELVKLVHHTITNCYPDCYANEVIDFFIEYHSSKELIRKAKEGELLIAFLDDKIIATGYLVKYELGGVYVHPEHQKKNIGKKIVQRLLDIASEKQLKSVWLDSTPFAVDLYTQFGFEIIEDKVMYVDDIVPLPYYYMRKELE